MTTRPRPATPPSATSSPAPTGALAALEPPVSLEQPISLEQDADAPTYVTGNGEPVTVTGDQVQIGQGSWPLSTALRLGLIVRRD